MNASVQQLLEDCSRLSDAEQHDVAAEILRRVSTLSDAPLTDAELTRLADESFLELDRQESVR